MNNEIWYPLKGYENLYEISKTGKIKSLKKKHRTFEKLLKPKLTKDGYYQVSLYKNGKSKCLRVHRLVALNFLENPENKEQVNHKDGNKLNNCVDNLEFCTNQENIDHSIRIGLQKPSGSTNSNAKKIAQYNKEGTLLATYECCKYAHDITNIPKSTLSKILNKKQKYWKEYYFKEVSHGNKSKCTNR